MKERIKNISFPALLLLVVSVTEIKSILSFIGNLTGGYIGIGSLFTLAELICPFVLFYLLFAKEEQKKPIGIAAVIFGFFTFFSGLLSVPNLFVFDAFIEAVVGGPLFSLLSDVLQGVLLLLLGFKLIKNQDVTKKYYVLCGLSIFLVGYASVFMAIANPLAIVSKLPTFLYILSLWYIPKLYVESEYPKTRVTSKKITTIGLVVVAMYALFLVAGGLSGTSSGSSNEPWKELGVSEKEYMDIYNYYKYGEHPK